MFVIIPFLPIPAQPYPPENTFEERWQLGFDDIAWQTNHPWNKSAGYISSSNHGPLSQRMYTIRKVIVLRRAAGSKKRTERRVT